MVMGFNGKNNLDIDRLTTMLEENRTLLNDMATKECTDGATLPKLLFELVEQATTAAQDGNKKITTPLLLSRSPSPSDKTNYSTELSAKKGTHEMQANDNDDDSVADYENDNENMASLISNVKQLQQNEMPAEEDEEDANSMSRNSGNISPATTHSLAQSHGCDAVDAAATNTDGKVTITAQIKGKKCHRKQAINSKKSSSSSSSSMSAGHSSTSTIANGSAAVQQLQDVDVIGKVASAQEIVGNLPKVWRVLMELLSHHKIDPVQFEENGKSEDCYKSVETPNGPKAELSVSKTYIKLKVSFEKKPRKRKNFCNSVMSSLGRNLACR